MKQSARQALTFDGDKDETLHREPVCRHPKQTSRTIRMRGLLWKVQQLKNETEDGW